MIARTPGLIAHVDRRTNPRKTDAANRPVNMVTTERLPEPAQMKLKSLTSKLQESSNHSKSKYVTRHLFWILEFGISLEFGAWDLQFKL